MRHEQAEMITPRNRVEKSTAVTTAGGNPSVAPPQYFKGVLSAEGNPLRNQLRKEASREKSPASRMCSGGFPVFQVLDILERFLAGAATRGSGW